MEDQYQVYFDNGSDAWFVSPLNIYSCGNNHFMDVLNHLSHIVEDMEGASMDYMTGVENRWSMGDTVFSVKAHRQSNGMYLLAFYFVDGDAELYLDTMFPMISDLLNMGVIESFGYNLEDEEAWRMFTISQMERLFGVSHAIADEDVGEIGEIF